jgi:hypothetical protein
VGIIKELFGDNRENRSPIQIECESVPVLIASALLMLIFPIVPIPSLLLLAVVDILLIAVAVLLVGLRLLLLPLGALHHVLVLQLPHLLQGHRRLVRVLLPHLRHQVRPLLGGRHALMDVLLGGHIPDGYLGDGFGEFLLVLGLSLGVLLDGVLVVEDVELLLNGAQLRDGLVDLHHQEVLDGLPLVALLLDLLAVLVSVLYGLLLLHGLDEFLPGGAVGGLFGLVAPDFKEGLGKDLLVLGVKLVHQFQEGHQVVLGGLYVFASGLLDTSVQPPQVVGQGEEPESP